MAVVIPFYIANFILSSSVISATFSRVVQRFYQTLKQLLCFPPPLESEVSETICPVGFFEDEDMFFVLRL